jgi:hypothetical protein
VQQASGAADRTALNSKGGRGQQNQQRQECHTTAADTASAQYPLPLLLHLPGHQALHACMAAPYVQHMCSICAAIQQEIVGITTMIFFTFQDLDLENSKTASGQCQPVIEVYESSC